MRYGTIGLCYIYVQHENGMKPPCCYLLSRDILFMICSVQRKKRDGTVVEIESPPCVQDNNINMGSVDKFDQLRQSYAIDRISRRWWKCIFTFA